MSTTRNNAGNSNDSRTSGGEIGHGSKPPYLTTNPVTLGVIHDLQKDKLVDNLDKLSFTLTDYGMTINGQSQPEEVFQQYKTKYLKHPKDHIRFSQHLSASGSRPRAASRQPI